MRIFKTKWFSRFAKGEKISDTVLIKAVDEMNRGLHDGNIGSGLFKKRIARQNEGKSGGFRTMIAFQKDQKSFFVFGFSKSNKDNLEADEEQGFKDMAQKFLSYSDAEIEIALKHGVFLEIKI